MEDWVTSLRQRRLALLVLDDDDELVNDIIFDSDDEIEVGGSGSGGSKPGKRPNINRQRQLYAQLLHQDYFDENAEDAAVWRPFFRDSLESTRRIIRRYADLGRHLELADRSALAEFEELLDNVSSTLRGLLKKLVDDDAAGLAAEAEVFKTTLQALNEVTLTRGGEQR